MPSDAARAYAKGVDFEPGEQTLAFLYGLIDTAGDDQLYEWVRATPEHACLFAGKLDPVLERASPHIVQLAEGSALLDRWRGEGWGQNWGIMCIADEPLSTVRRHFRHFLQVQVPDGKIMLFRFYDPRVWRVYLPTCKSGDLQNWFAHVNEYRCEAPGGAGTLSYTWRAGKLTVAEIE